LKDKLEITAEEKIEEEQFGFRKGRSHIYTVFAIKQLMENRKEFNCALYMLFLGYEKAYDRVNTQNLWKFVENYGVPKNLLNLIQSIYEITTIKIKLDAGKTTEAFEVNQGLRQGCGLSPLLFILHLDKIIKEWKSLKPPGIKIDAHTTLSTVIFADDQVLIAESENDLQRAVFQLQNILKNYNTEISEGKTRSMVVTGKTPKAFKYELITK
jgi:hypothetical protein